MLTLDFIAIFVSCDQMQKSFKHTNYWSVPAHGSTMTSLGPKIIVKMTLGLFHKVPAGAIERFFDQQNQPLFKGSALGKYLGKENIKHNFKDFPSHYTHLRSDLEGRGLTAPLRGQKIPMIFLLIWLVL